MKTKNSFLLITALFAIIIGGIIFVVAMSLNGWDFSKISTAKPETNTYELEGEINTISISLDTEDVLILPYEGDKITAVCNESDKLKHSVTLENGELKISRLDTRKWYNHIMNFTKDKITLYLPTSTYASLNVKSETSDIELAQGLIFKSIDVSVSTGRVNCQASSIESTKITASTGDLSLENQKGSLTLKTSTGKINVSNSSLKDVSISVSTGDVNLNNLTCANLSSRGSTGKINLTGVTASGVISIERDTGNVSFNACDASEIYVKTSTGNVSGSLLSDKVFICKSSTGNINVPESVVGGKCKIETSTGDIKISISK